MEKPLPLSKEQRLYAIVQQGVKTLKEEKGYLQCNLLQKFKTLDLAISPASLSNIVHGKTAGLQVLGTASKAVQAVVRQELGLEFCPEARAFIKTANSDWQPYTVPENEAVEAAPPLTLHAYGRVPIRYKADFIAGAQKEVIEVGIRLKTFADYFISRNEQEYKAYIVALLKRGVRIRGYLLDPDCNEALLYFADRARAQESEAEAVAEIKKVIGRLRGLVREFEQQKYPGSFEIYLYKHVPYCHFLAIDPGCPGGRLLVSNYLYGLRRAECPVWEFDQRKQPVLFGKYAASLQVYLRDAKRLGA